MSRTVCLLAFLLALVMPLSAQAAETDGSASSTDGIISSTLQRFNLASITGKSPWLVIAGRGAYQYFTTPAEQQARLGFTSHPAVFGTLGVLLLLVAVKDSLLTFLGKFKVPLDVLAELFHVAGGAAGFIFLGDVAFAQPEPAVQQFADTGTAPEQTSWLWSVTSYLMMCVVHAAVWIVFNTIEVAIILSPFPLVDTALKAFRTALIGIITAAAAIHPVLGFLIALPIFLIVLAIVPFALRFTRVGWVFCLDILSRWFGAKEPTGSVRAFASWSLPGATLFRYGEVTPTPDGKRAFTYRRFGFLWKKSVPLPDEVYVGIGTFYPVLLVDQGGSTRQLLMFPPRYDQREQALAAQLGINRVENVSLKASLRWIIARLFGKKDAQPASV
jgi:hypothetical protein